MTFASAVGVSHGFPLFRRWACFWNSRNNELCIRLAWTAIRRSLFCVYECADLEASFAVRFHVRIVALTAKHANIPQRKLVLVYVHVYRFQIQYRGTIAFTSHTTSPNTYHSLLSNIPSQIVTAELIISLAH